MTTLRRLAVSLRKAVRTGVALLVVILPARAQTPTPSFAELEAAGAVIGDIRIAAENIFDTNDPKEDHPLFRWANALHIPTRPSVIRRALLFKPGDVVSVRLIEETERLLRSNDYLYDVKF